MNKIAIFGGTFDPIHSGHLNLAKEAVRVCGLDKLIFMPNYISPFKTEQKTSSGELRYEMIEKILHYDRAFSISAYEIERDVPSYTYNTLSHFRDEYGAEIYFVLGFDSILLLDTWHRGPDLLREFSFITTRRPGYDDHDVLEMISRFECLYGANINVLDIEAFEASSTDIRKRIRVGLPISHLVPEEIERYINEHGLYR
jgi:nicotinate-nucleotide adenylyltransferase